MKKFYLTFLAIFVILFPSSVRIHGEAVSQELLHDSFITALEPHISEAIAEHKQKMKTYGAYNMNYGLYDVKIIDIEREEEGGYSFNVVLTVRTFEHAHNPPHFTETISLRVNPYGIRVTDIQLEGDDEFYRVERFYKNAISDIKQTFSLNLESYQRYNMDDLHNRLEKKQSFTQLYDYAKEIQNKYSTREDKTPPLHNVMKPMTYIKSKNGYILFKQANGVNVMYKLKKQNSNWKVVGHRTKPGKKMEKELLWYL
ncbi:DUF3888 domain-containing protein [Salinibacillus xinjiangensis]|uniref:DUF3888 domain-containing protein n=1 Tax=Salinibacillus xinjiangensis TaxID=1229268 RepID=A0A6G1X656_9BACI|nr:DUF3888 domain-containing protein [Salinibacillus xinjiangensis]MRG86483.1 DUF3888 domain-containing protein [Salinibacillus xinjiangensis]